MADMYWEEYDDQEDGMFTTLLYIDLTGATVSVPIDGCLADQVAQIRRANGIDTYIRVARPNAMQAV